MPLNALTLPCSAPRILPAEVLTTGLAPSLVAGTAHARVTAPPASKLAAAVPLLRNVRRLIASVMNEDS